MDKRNLIELLERLVKENLICFVLANLISSDNSLEEKKSSLHLSKELLLFVDEANIDVEIKNKITKYLNDTINVLEKEVK